MAWCFPQLDTGGEGQGNPCFPLTPRETQKVGQGTSDPFFAAEPSLLLPPGALPLPVPKAGLCPLGVPPLPREGHPHATQAARSSGPKHYLPDPTFAQLHQPATRSPHTECQTPAPPMSAPHIPFPAPAQTPGAQLTCLNCSS